MTNYQDPDATETIARPCACPLDPKPHPEDVVTIHRFLGYRARGAVSSAGFAGTPGIYDLPAATMKLIEVAAISWNLVLPNGTPRPLDEAQIGLLDQGTVDWIADEVDRICGPSVPLPNESGAPSATTSRGSASRTRGRRKG